MSAFNLSSISSEFILIAISILIGIAIGTEREYRNKSAGLRTLILVSFGSCVFTILSLKLGIATPDRIAANIITGIGFLGAGVIFKEENKIGRITTATTIWATASLGMCAGSGHIYLSILGTIVVLIILSLLIYLQDFIDNYHKIREYRLTASSLEDYEYCMELFRKHQLKYSLVKARKDPGSYSGTWSVSGNYKQHAQLTEQLLKDPRILSYQF